MCSVKNLLRVDAADGLAEITMGPTLHFHITDSPNTSLTSQPRNVSACLLTSHNWSHVQECAFMLSFFDQVGCFGPAAAAINVIIVIIVIVIVVAVYGCGLLILSLKSVRWCGHSAVEMCRHLSMLLLGRPL